MLDYRSLAQRRSPGLALNLRSSCAPKDLRRHDSVIFKDPAPEAVPAPPPPPEKVLEVAQAAPVQVGAELRVLEPPVSTPEQPDKQETVTAERPKKRKARGAVCLVCGRKRSRKRLRSVGGRRMSRCWRCDLLTIIDRRAELSPVAHAEHLRYSMKTFWFHLRSQLAELGNRGPVGYCGPEEYSAPIAAAARDLAFVVPLEELERYTGPGQCPAILLFHALECVPDPGNLLAKCRRMLAADGRLFVATSDANSIQCLLRPSKWSGLQLKAQQCCYSSGTLARLFRVTGFRIARRLRSGLEVLGMSLEDAFAAPPIKKPGFRGFLDRWILVMKRLAHDISACGSVLYLEAVPNKHV